MAFAAKSREQLPDDAVLMTEDEFLLFHSKLIGGYEPSFEV